MCEGWITAQVSRPGQVVFLGGHPELLTDRSNPQGSGAMLGDANA